MNSRVQPTYMRQLHYFHGRSDGLNESSHQVPCPHRCMRAVGHHIRRGRPSSLRGSSDAATAAIRRHRAYARYSSVYGQGGRYAAVVARVLVRARAARNPIRGTRSLRGAPHPARPSQLLDV